MQIKGLGVPRPRYLERAAIDVSQKARQCLGRADYCHAHGNNAAPTSRSFGISWQTLYC